MEQYKNDWKLLLEITVRVEYDKSGEEEDDGYNEEDFVIRATDIFETKDYADNWDDWQRNPEVCELILHILERRSQYVIDRWSLVDIYKAH